MLPKWDSDLGVSAPSLEMFYIYAEVRAVLSELDVTLIFSLP